MLETEIRFYQTNQEELLSVYQGKFLVIKKDKILAVYDTFERAYIESRKKNRPGTFLIQHCEEGKGVYIQTFQARLPIRYVRPSPDFIQNLSR